MAGLDAGHAYNTFPLMDGKLVPDEYWGGGGWRNAFENTAAVQLHHRALALSTLAGVTALWAGSRSLQLPRPCRLLVNGMLAMAGLQVLHCSDMAAFCSLSLPQRCSKMLLQCLKAASLGVRSASQWRSDLHALVCTQ